uniref:Uncharacterized protein n=1 Tax=Lotus japonicus TaxID=34305 RepID=I3SAJ2_LOTJA|nr:unknown [Lotus japonicus]
MHILPYTFPNSTTLFLPTFACTTPTTSIIPSSLPCFPCCFLLQSSCIPFPPLFRG